MTPYSINLTPSEIPFSNLMIFGVLFILLLLTVRKRSENFSLISPEASTMLKGFAMLAVIAIHIGYSLTDPWQFLHPLSSFWGVAVDIFLLLSGYGLAHSMIKKPLGVLDFYKKRLVKVFIPFWVVLAIFIVMDALILGKIIDLKTLISSIFVYFPSADIWEDFNSPLWYLSWLAFFYILFPIVFRVKYPIISSIILFALGWLLVVVNPGDMQTNWLHGLHLFAFPFGVALAGLETKKIPLLQKYSETREKISKSFLVLVPIFLIFTIGYFIWKADTTNIASHITFFPDFIDTRLFLEQVKSILLSIFTILLFTITPLRFGFLSIFGILSYELYLIHWPLMARYDILFHALPAWVATILTIAYLMALAYGLQKLIQKIFS